MARKIVFIVIITIVAALCGYWVWTFDYLSDSKGRYSCKEEPNKPNEPEITHTTLEIPDPNDDIWLDFDYDPYPTTVTLPRYTFEGMDFKEEITLKLGGGSEIVCNVTERLFWVRMYGALSGKAPTEEVSLRFKPEPNKPNEPEPKKYSLPIPTWPDYIELPKTLHLYWEDPNPDPNRLFNTDSEWVIGKGTKIYFKDD